MLQTTFIHFKKSIMKILFTLLLVSFAWQSMAQKSAQKGTKKNIVIEKRAGYYLVTPNGRAVDKDTIVYANAGFIIDKAANLEEWKGTDGKTYVSFRFPNFTNGTTQVPDHSNNQQQDDTIHILVDSLRNIQHLDLSTYSKINTGTKINKKGDTITLHQLYFPYNGRRLAMEKSVFEALPKHDSYATWCQEGAGAWRTGLLTVPLKIRPDWSGNDTINPQLTGDVLIGPYLGRFWRINKRQNIHLGLIATGGLSFLNIPNNTASATRPDDPDDIVFGFTWSAGLVLEVEEFTVGFVTGADYSFGNYADWYYNGQPWISFSIGHNFLQKRKKD